MSEYATTERLGRLKAWICELSAMCAQMYPDNVKWEQRWYDLQAAADAFEKSISTPIPLTPSDEMVVAAFDATVTEGFPVSPVLLKAALTAALNLMGGDK